MRGSALVVMCKSPVAGRVKTRLVPPLTGVEAATLYTHFIADIFCTLKRVSDVKLYLAILGEGSEKALELSIPKGVEVFGQSGDDLGERLYDVMKRLFENGHERVAIIGSDSPDIPPEYIADAFLRLKADSSKVVLGPADDGGYYLIALARLDERPFIGINWSTASVLEDTIARLRNDALLLEPWYDVDRPADILRLVKTGRAGRSIAYINKMDILKHCKEFVSGE